MQKDYQYLHTSTKELWWRYGALYALLLSAAISYDKSLLQTTFWYWLVCGILFYLEYKGTYFLIKDEKLIGHASFIHGIDIPLEKIKSLKKGRSTIEIFKPECITIFFEDEKGKEGVRMLPFHRFNPKEIAKFVTDISIANPSIVVDEGIKNWLTKNLNVTEREKIGRTLFPGRSVFAPQKIFHQDIEEQARKYHHLGILDSYRGNIVLFFGACTILTLAYLLFTIQFLGKGGIGIVFLVINLPLLFVYSGKKWPFYALSLAAFIDPGAVLGILVGILNISHLKITGPIVTLMSIIAGIKLMMFLNAAIQVEALRKQKIDNHESWRYRRNS